MFFSLLMHNTIMYCNRLNNTASLKTFRDQENLDVLRKKNTAH